MLSESYKDSEQPKKLFATILEITMHLPPQSLRNRFVRRQRLRVGMTKYSK